MTVSSEAGEFDSAVNSVSRYSDPVKSDFAQLIGISQDHVSKIFRILIEGPRI